MNDQAVELRLLALLLLLGLVSGLLVFIAKLRFIRHHVRKQYLFIELTPPPTTVKSPLATEQFFTVLSNFISIQPWQDSLRGKKASIALEVVSTRPKGIRYIVRVAESDEALFLQNLAAYLPAVTTREIEDYLPTGYSTKDSRVLEFRQSGGSAYPLRHMSTKAPHDPISYLTNAISQLAKDELIALQLVLTPVRTTTVRSTIIGKSKLVEHPDEMLAALQTKATQPIFHANVRVLVHVDNERISNQRVKGIRSSLAAYTYEGYQSLLPRLEYPAWLNRYRLRAFRLRLPSIFVRNSCMLATSEVAALYHFPFGAAAQTEDLAIEHRTVLPAPLALKVQTDFDVVLGENLFRNVSTLIGLTTAERQRHVYVIGGTGNGKTTLLQYSIVQDMLAGKGVAVLDPHGDLAQTLLQYVPEDRVDDVIYFNPSDLSYPTGLNLLELTPGLEGDELLHEKDMVTESIVSMFRKIFSTNDTSGHRVEYVLRNAIQTALTLEDPTLFTIYHLLNDKAFRTGVVKNLEDKDLCLFWKNEFGKAGAFQQVTMAAGITAKIGRFLFSASARRIIEQPHSTINFDELLQSGKILICNLAKGHLGEDTSELFGIMLLAKLQLAALHRAGQRFIDRHPFYLYVDEFQNFATPSFVEMLSEARKYGLFLTMAEQSTSQQSDQRMVNTILANVGTVICFRTSSPADEQLILPLLQPYIQAGTINSLPAYNFYMRIAAVDAHEPFSGRTLLLPAEDASPLMAQLTIKASRSNYARQPTSKPTTKKGTRKSKTPARTSTSLKDEGTS